MNVRLLQIDFAFNGPWGDELAAALQPLAADIAAEPGLRWKIWTENRASGEAGGIYLFDDDANLERYLDKHTKRLAGFGITRINAKRFEVNQTLSRITGGDYSPISESATSL